jgi:hypothetical protein
MTDSTGQRGSSFLWDYEQHRIAQARMGLRLTYCERLRWLEQTMAILRRWRGRARAKAGSSPKKQNNGQLSD